MLNRDIIEVPKYKEPGTCQMCGKWVNWIECENKNELICSNCWFKKSKKEWKLVESNFGFKIVMEANKENGL